MLRHLNLLLATLAAFVLAACDYAPSNVMTLQTTDCGVTWSVVKIGQRVPSTTGNRCGYNTVLPDFPMQGDTEFITQFSGNILVKVKISYDWQIIDPVKFIDSAKFLGRMSGSAADAAASTKMGQFETVENVVIDVRLREIVTSTTIKDDIVTFNPSAFEDVLFIDSNKALAERGVKLNSMTFVTIPEDQTRMAIDAATAMSVYRSKGMEELGTKLAIARAGATSVTVNAAGSAK